MQPWLSALELRSFPTSPSRPHLVAEGGPRPAPSLLVPGCGTLFSPEHSYFPSPLVLQLVTVSLIDCGDTSRLICPGIFQERSCAFNSHPPIIQFLFQVWTSPTLLGGEAGKQERERFQPSPHKDKAASLELPPAAVGGLRGHSVPGTPGTARGGTSATSGRRCRGARQRKGFGFAVPWQGAEPAETVPRQRQALARTCRDSSGCLRSPAYLEERRGFCHHCLCTGERRSGFLL